MGAKVINEIEAAGNRLTDVDVGGIPLRISKGTAADNNWKGLRYGLHHLGLKVDNLHEFIDDMKAKSVEVVTEPFQIRAMGMKVAFIKGPDGVLFELIEKSGD
ncbi:MAG: VOC family protein [Desulfobacterales bacterium]